MDTINLSAALIIFLLIGHIGPYQQQNQSGASEFDPRGEIGVILTKVNLVSNDIIYDPIRDIIYASVPTRSGSMGNSIIPISVPDGKLDSPIFVGSEPNKLAISKDGKYLYVGLDGAASIRRVDLTKQTADLQFPLWSEYCGASLAEDIVVLNNMSSSVAVSKRNAGCSPRHGGVTIYDDGVARTISTPGHTGSNVIEPSETESILYGYNNETTDYGFRVMSVMQTGVEIASTTSGLISGFSVDIRSSQGLIYATNGVVINPDTLSIVGTYPTSGSSVLPDPTNGIVYFLGTDLAGQAALFINDKETFNLITSVTIPDVFGTPESLIKIGEDAFAFRSNDDQLLLIKLFNIQHAYLPLVMQQNKIESNSGIYGYVTHSSWSAPAISLDLRFYDGTSWSTRASVMTDNNGFYSFLGVPSLEPGQIYFVLYSNDTDPSRLSAWYTRELQHYSVGSEVNIGNFDIANVDFVEPQPGATVALPYNFQWYLRATPTTDSYDFNLFDPSDYDPFFYTDPPLVYTTQYTLASLPTGFSYGVTYGWSIGVFSPDGGYGDSYWYYEVTLSESQSQQSWIGGLDQAIPLNGLKLKPFLESELPFNR